MQKKSKKTGDGEENGGPTTVVLMVEMDCEGCSNKVKGSLKGFDGSVVKTCNMPLSIPDLFFSFNSFFAFLRFSQGIIR